MTAPTESAEPAVEPEAGEPAADQTDWKAESRKWEQRAKEHSAAAKEFEKQRHAAMTDAEKAVAEAETRGRTAAVQDYGKRLARSEFDALAGRRNADFDTAPVFDYLDLAKFVGDDGEPDVKAITAAVERLIPAVAAGVPSFDGGSRTPAASGDMNSFIRRAAGR